METGELGNIIEKRLEKEYKRGEEWFCKDGGFCCENCKVDESQLREGNYSTYCEKGLENACLVRNVRSIYGDNPITKRESILHTL